MFKLTLQYLPYVSYVWFCLGIVHHGSEPTGRLQRLFVEVRWFSRAVPLCLKPKSSEIIPKFRMQH